MENMCGKFLIFINIKRVWHLKIIENVASATVNSVRKSISILKDLGFECFIQLSIKWHFFHYIKDNHYPNVYIKCSTQDSEANTD